MTALRIEWEAWWRELTLGPHHAVLPVSPPEFPEFQGSPALQRFVHAHFGAAVEWSQERKAEYTDLVRARMQRGALIFNGLVEERELELGRGARDFTLDVVELPLSENRAWYVEPNKLIMSQGLHDDKPAFRSFVQPVVELLA